MKSLKEPTNSKWLTPLLSHRQSLSQLSMSDLQLLMSSLSGSSLIVADILDLCINYLCRPTQITPRDLAFLVDYLENQEARKREILEDLESQDEDKKSATQNHLNDLLFRVSQHSPFLRVDSSSFIGSLDGQPILCGSILQAIEVVAKSVGSATSLSSGCLSLISTLKERKQTTEDNLIIMETILMNALNIVKEQFRHLVEQLIHRNQFYAYPIEDRDLLLDWFRRNPLFDNSLKQSLISFLTDDAQVPTSGHENGEHVCSDPHIALQNAFGEIDRAEQDLDLLFMILRGEEQNVSEERRDELITKLINVRSRIVQTMRDVFGSPALRHRFSWKDITSLLCSPNGTQSRSLTAIQFLGDTSPQFKQTISIEIVDRLAAPPKVKRDPSPPIPLYESDSETESTPTPAGNRHLQVARKVNDNRSGSQ
ncbi:hypothetical protein BLNAU_13688 [Blattamonas nauphoetae]|uniref:Uncharacterized protein n=1 Tax=Blattamonas nauphoetae TaxID=2049346 RepID=A0ABQ9XJA2_9EUKA|nr:hypothetical protein BLNAU_13688 [Blattamonas nauphoetae]